MKKILFLWLFLFSGLLLVAGNENESEGEASMYALKGRVFDASTGESLPGATIYVGKLRKGAVTDLDGRFIINIPAGTFELECTFIGYKKFSTYVNASRIKELQIRLEPSAELLKEVVIRETRSNENIASTEMSLVKLENKTIKSIPAFMGEVDLIKVIQLLPGIQSSGEGSTGFNVRGGSIDQNLILMDEATVYNASHLMGFFSVFNNDVVKDLSLYKGNIPAEYGGRLSSLLNITTREGDMNKFHGAGGIGSISSRLMLEGPLVKNKVSFIASGRRSYADMFLPLAPDTSIRGHKLYFYDVNLKLHANIDKNNRVSYSAYNGQDVFSFGKEEPFTISWGNTTHTLRWNHIFNSRLFANFYGIYSGYSYYLEQEAENLGFRWDAFNEDYGLRADFTYIPNANNSIRFGASSTLQKFSPGIVSLLGDGNTQPVGSPESNALLHALFASNQQTINDKWSLDYGIRLSVFQNIGATTVYNFNKDYEYVDSTVYNKGEIYNTYWGLEPRLGVKYGLNENASLKASFSRTLQFTHLASYSTGGNPLDVWVPSSPFIKPQTGNQYAVGYFHNFQLKDEILETSVELFYKDMRNQIDFKDNAWLMLNPKIEGEFRFGKAEAYGAEFLVRKHEGRLNGWVSYTLSKARRHIDEINDGKPYVASYDRPHSISVVANFEASDRVTFSAAWVYASGTPVTLPSGRFEYGNQVFPVYTDRNTARLEDYHRLDLGITIRNGLTKQRRFKSEWNISVYNAYYRKNTWMIDFRENKEQAGQMEAYKVYLFPILPSVTYNFSF